VSGQNRVPSIANAKLLRGELDEAETELKDVLHAARQFHDLDGVADVEYSLAVIAADRGLIPEARARYRRALVQYMDVDDADGVARTQRRFYELR